MQDMKVLKDTIHMTTRFQTQCYRTTPSGKRAHTDEQTEQVLMLFTCWNCLNQTPDHKCKGRPIQEVKNRLHDSSIELKQKKLAGETDLELYEQTVKMHKQAMSNLGQIIKTCLSKGWLEKIL